MTGKIREQLDSRKYGCRIFVDFQQAFDTVDHAILAQKLNYYGVWGKANNWFPSYPKNRTQFVTKKDLKEINSGVPQGLVLIWCWWYRSDKP